MKKVLRVLIVMFTIVFTLYCPWKSVKAEEGVSVFNGLFLIDGEVQLNRVDIDVSVDDYDNCKVTATYEMTNDTEESQSLVLGIPLTDNKLSDYKYSFTPYQYSTIVVSGGKINNKIEQLDVDFDKWRNYSIPMTLSEGESAEATVSFTIKPKQDFPGKVTFDMDMSHLKSWGEEAPEKVNIEASFNPQTVKIYNFDNEFSIEPSEITPEYKYIWNLSEKDVYGDISFSYFFVDDEIIRQLTNLKSSIIDDMVKSYSTGDYQKVIDNGKKYISTNHNEENQNVVYLMMADAYMALKEYEETLTVCDLIETSGNSFGEIDEKIKEKMLYNRIQSYSGLKEYEEMYDLIDYELNYSNRNTYMVEWLKTKRDLIPDEELQKIKEARQEPSKLEKLIKKFFQGEYNVYFIAATLSVIILAIIIYIRRKKKRDRFFY